MLTAVKNNIRFFMQSMKCNLKSCLEYKKSFFLQVIFMMVNNLFFLIFWSVVFHVNGGNVNDITFKEILVLWAIPPGAWGIANFFFDGINQINHYILNGSLDTYLLQPKNLLLSVSLSKMDFGACGDLIYGLIVGIAASSSVIEYLEILFFMVTGAIIMASCIILVRTLAIWIGDVEQIALVYTQNLMITFSSYPYEIFGKVIRALMFTIIPAYFISQLPFKIIEVYSFKSVLKVITVAIVLLIFAIIFFHLSIKKYESGNNIAMKE